MSENTLVDTITDQTRRSLWEVENVIACIPVELWERAYCGVALSRHVYHMLHSLDLWLINPRDPAFVQPECHETDLNNLDVVSAKRITRTQIESYLDRIKEKITAYLAALDEAQLRQKPPGCEYSRFTLILAQHRHLHTHMGMIMGFLVADTGKWPAVLGLECPIPATGAFGLYYE